MNKSHRASHYLFLGIMISLLIAPFLVTNHPYPIPSFYSESIALVSGSCLVVWMLIEVRKRAELIQIPPIASLPVGLALILILQIFNGYYAFALHPTVGLTFLLWALSLILVGHFCRRFFADSFPHVLAWSLLVGSFLNAVIGIIQVLGIPAILNDFILPAQFDAQAGVYGNIAQQNHFASYLNLGVVSTLYLRQQAKIKTIVAMTGVLILGIAIVLSASRSGLILFLACISMYGWRVSRDRYSQSVKRYVGLAVLAGVILLCLLAYCYSFAPFERLMRLGETLGTRGMLWLTSLFIIKENLFLGVGLEGFAYQMSKALPKLGLVSPWGVDQYAHNIVLQIFATLGVLGGAWLMFHVIRLVHFVSLARLRYPSLIGGDLAHELYACSILAILFSHSLIEQPLHYSYYLGLFALLLGFIDVRKFSVFESSSAQRLIQLGVVVISLIVLCGTLYELKFFNRYQNLSQQTSYQAQRSDLREVHTHSLLKPYLELAYPHLIYAGNYSVETKLMLNTQWMRFFPTSESLYLQAIFYCELGNESAMNNQLDQAMHTYSQDIPAALQRYETLARSNPVKFQALWEAANARYKRLPQAPQHSR